MDDPLGQIYNDDALFWMEFHAYYMQYPKCEYTYWQCNSSAEDVIHSIMDIPGFWGCIEEIAKLGQDGVYRLVKDYDWQRFEQGEVRPDSYGLTQFLANESQRAKEFLEICALEGYDAMVDRVADYGDIAGAFEGVAGFVMIQEAYKLAGYMDEEKSIMEASYGEENENTERMHQEQPIHSKAASL